MCNLIHVDSKPVKPYGIGYKFVDFIASNGKIVKVPPYHFKKISYKEEVCGWISWNGKLTNSGIGKDEIGFCIFKNMKDAEYIYGLEVSTYNCAIYKVQYAEGICTHLEKSMCDISIPIILTKSFRFLERIL